MQVADGRGHRIFQATGGVGPRHRYQQCRTELAEGVEYVLGLVAVGLDCELVTGSRRAADVERHPRCSNRGAAHGTGAYRLAVCRVRLCIHRVIGGVGELDDRPAAWKGALVISVIGHAGTGDLRRGRIAGTARCIQRIRLGLKLERMPGDGQVRVSIAFLQVDTNLEVHTTKADGLAVLGVAIERTVAGRLRSDVVAVGIGDAVLGAADEIDGVRLPGNERLVVNIDRVEQAGRYGYAAVIDCWRHQGRLGAAFVQGLLEHTVAGVVGRQVQGIGHLQAELGLVALIAVGAIAVAHVRRGRTLGPGEQVLAVGILGVEQAEHVVFDLADFAGDGFTVGIAQAAVTGLQGQLLGTLQGIGDARQHAFFLGQRVGDRGHVAVVLLEQRALLLQQQQLGCPDRIIGCRLNTSGRSDLLVGLGRIGKVLLIVGRAGLEILRGGNPHGRLLPYRALSSVLKVSCAVLMICDEAV
ncbi:hypothetical protein D9M71_293700 [compost metagenome]